jgi:hypothetical protein
MLSHIMKGGLWEPLAPVDFLPPGNPEGQDLPIGTTSATIDFGAATGVATSGTPTVSLSKPTGSLAVASVAANGAGWRVSLSSLANGESYGVTLVYLSVDGQVAQAFARVDVASSGLVTNWLTLVDLDLTNCTAQAGLGAEGTYTIVIGGVSVSLVVSRSTGTSGVCTAALVNGTGLTISHLPGASAPTNRTFGFNLSGVYGAGLKPDVNNLCFEVVASISSMPTNLDVFTWEVGESNPIDSNNPGYTARLSRASGNSYLGYCGYRVTSTATLSPGQTFKTSAPTAWHAQIVGMQRSWRVYMEEGLSPSSPGSPALVGNCGTAVVTPADSAADVWSTPTYGQFTVTGYGATAPVELTLKRIRVLARQPVQ